MITVVVLPIANDNTIHKLTAEKTSQND